MNETNKSSKSLVTKLFGMVNRYVTGAGIGAMIIGGILLITGNFLVINSTSASLNVSGFVFLIIGLFIVLMGELV